jgi:hypothetical protein
VTEPAVTRRRLLAALGVGSASAAGCSSGDEGASPTATATEPPVDGTATPAETSGSTLDLGCREDAHHPEPAAQSHARYRVRSWHEVETVWPGTNANYALLTAGEDQFVAFYEADADAENYQTRGGRVTVGQRRVGCGSAWQFVQPESWLAWDSHNYLTMALDDAGHLHVTGNMHVAPLNYWRTRVPRDVTTLERVGEMVGEAESQVTYPKFFRGPDGRLLFTYRSGSSGSGNQIYNAYDPERREWERLLDQPLIDGEGENNAYIRGPQLGPDGRYHLCWVWRRTPDAATNHDLSYARSPDLLHRERSDGTPLELPITIDEAEVVDPVPAGGGMINGNTEIGFDRQERVILSYHKYDEDGATQIYNARRESDGWERYRTSDWDYRWEFGGGGTISFDVDLSGVSVDDAGRLVQSYDHVRAGAGTWVLDPERLTPTAEIHRPPTYPDLAAQFDPGDDRLQLNWTGDLGESGDPEVHYALRWPTLPSNRDQFQPDVPEPTSLRCYEFVRNPAAEATVVER